jgi:hypothetical protein
MDDLTRKVIARFREDFDEKSPDEGKPWMDYILEKNVGPKPSIPAAKLLEHAKGMGEGQSIYNPYDYEDPSSAPKDPKGPPFISEPLVDYGIYTTPKIFDEQGELDAWKGDREQDPTVPEEDQSPAMSLTCKFATVRKVIARHFLNTVGINIFEDGYDDLFIRTKVAASMSEIVDKDYHYLNDRKMQRSDSVTALWANKGNIKDREKGYFIFKVSSPGSDSGTHTVYLQFLRGEDEKQYGSYSEYPVQLACTCPSFLFHGAQYYAVHDKYMYLPAMRTDVLPPKAPDVVVVHQSPAYPTGRKYPGRGLNFRVCKHLLKVYDTLKTMRIETTYRKYPITAPPSKIMNAEVWNDMMKFEFTEANIKQRLKANKPKIPAYFNRENITQSVIDWLNQVWIPRTDDQKIKALRDLVEYPERIFFILMKEAYLKRARGEYISDRLISEAYSLMSRVVQPENKETPQQVETEGPVPELGKGTGAISPPGGDLPADKFIQDVEPATQETPSQIAPSTLRPKKKPFIDTLKERQEKLRERGIGERAKAVIKRFKGE